MYATKCIWDSRWSHRVHFSNSGACQHWWSVRRPGVEDTFVFPGSYSSELSSPIPNCTIDKSNPVVEFLQRWLSAPNFSPVCNFTENDLCHTTSLKQMHQVQQVLGNCLCRTSATEVVGAKFFVNNGELGQIQPQSQSPQWVYSRPRKTPKFNSLALEPNFPMTHVSFLSRCKI